MLKKLALAALSLMLLCAIATGIAARLREGKVKSVKTGMIKADVERLLGPGMATPVAPVCPTCPAVRKQYEYQGNPTLWYGHFADKLVVCYVNDVVCGTTRLGL